jgi:hypothetical protein
MGLVLIVPLLVAGCGGDTPTSPSTTTTTTTVAAASVSEEFTGTLPVGGAAFYSFTVAEYGTVNLTLTQVGGAGVPATVWVGVGLGTPSGEDCSAPTTINTPAGTTAQLTGTYAAGVYCARVWDIGNLASRAAFALTIAHP